MEKIEICKIRNATTDSRRKKKYMQNLTRTNVRYRRKKYIYYVRVGHRKCQKCCNRINMFQKNRNWYEILNLASFTAEWTMTFGQSMAVMRICVCLSFSSLLSSHLSVASDRFLSATVISDPARNTYAECIVRRNKSFSFHFFFILSLRFDRSLFTDSVIVMCSSSKSLHKTLAVSGTVFSVYILQVTLRGVR